MEPIPSLMDRLPGGRGQSIGAILIETGRLAEADAQAVVEEQRLSGGLFGSTAMRLGLIGQDDVDFALARQFDYPFLIPESGVVEPQVIAASQPFGEVAEQLRMLRSQLALRWFNGQPGRRCLAIAGLARGDGRSFVAANLAVAFAQQGLRTLLIDADLRRPVQHELFHVANAVGLSSLLVGRVGSEVLVRIVALRNLWLLPAGPIPPNPQELLGRGGLAEQLREMEQMFDVVIADTSAAAEAADGQLVAAATGAAVMVVRQNVTALEPLRAFKHALDASGSRVVGAVMNRR